MKIGDQSMAIYLGCLRKAKTSDVSPSKAEISSLSDLKIVIQPMLEVMAAAELAFIPKKEVPLVNVLGSKIAFRPFIYFHSCDVLLTTPTAMPLRRATDTIDVREFKYY